MQFETLSFISDSQQQYFIPHIADFLKIVVFFIPSKHNFESLAE